MNSFEYVAAATSAEAVQALSARDGTSALAGGTDLINRMKDLVTSPARVVYVRDLKDLAGIREDDQGLRIGAGTRLAELLANPVVAERYPAIRQAALEIGTPQIRNMATVGGNLLQRPRDWYFRQGFGLHGKVPGHEGHALRDGDNRYGAIFMTDGPALYVSPSSLAPPLVALGARAVLQGPKGERTVPVAELYRVPRAEAEGELTVEPGELLSHVIVPAPKGKNATYEVRWKQSHDWPLALASVALQMDGANVSQATVVLGAVAPVPLRSAAVEAALKGQSLNRETAEAAAAAAVKDAKPLSMNAYKVQLTKVAVTRALLTAAGDRYWEA